MPDDKNFVHLHVHTEYSLLDGLSNIKKLVKYAKDAGMPALAISDHGAMFGVIDFYRAAKNAGIKPIIGMEAYLAPRKMTDRDPQFDTKPYHTLLLARDINGYKNLLKIASASQLHGYYYRPRIDHDFLAAHSQGLIATSGCLAAEIPRMVEHGRDDEALRLIGWYQDVFGKDNFFLELQHHDIDILHILNRWLVEKSDYARVPLIATNDVHYVKAEDYDAHDTLLCIQTGGLKKEENRFKMTDPSYHLRTPDEMWRLFGDVPEALDNSLLIADMCNVDLDSKGYHLPVFPVPEGFTAETYLRYLCERGLDWRYGDHADDPDVRARLDYELGTIHNMGFETYFLIVWDLCEFARHADIWWNVRGSGAGSVAAYTLGITSIEPMSNALLFERFLNPGRVTMPDIDMDFPEDRRAEMIQYCAQKYGEDKVAAIITFGTMGSKAAIRDVGRALDVPLPEVDRIARLIPTAAKAIKFDDALGDDPEKALPDLKKLYDEDDEARRLIDIARALEGVTRHASTHAAGVIIADQPLVEYIPLHRVTGGSEESAPVKMVTQFPMETCESIGLLKVDFLGLSTLTIMRKACELVERYHGIHYDLSNIPYRPDPDTPEINDMLVESFKMLSRGETIGVFQLESQGMRRMLTDMRPHKFEHIVAAVALYRPGPMDYIPTYNKRLHGEEPVVYHHPKLESILSETYGICVSGDSIVTDVITGQRFRVDQLADQVGKIQVQGVDEQYHPAVGLVTHLIDNGEKPVYRVTLRNGATIKTTHDHRFLSEDGWKPLHEIQVGDYLATPPYLLLPEKPSGFNRDKLRVLAYLIADGSLASGCSVDFVSKDQHLLDEYVRCLSTFGDLTPVYTPQLRDVTRVGVRSNKYKSVNSLLAWMRELGFKYPPGLKHPRGVRSQEKSLPEFVFKLSDDEIAFFLASLWDCDGFVDADMWHYKTISAQLATDVQTLLLRLGISSTIYQSHYESSRGDRTAYQVTSYETARLSKILFPYMIVTAKTRTRCDGMSRATISRLRFLDEVKKTSTMSARQMMAQYGIDRQHFYKSRLERKRIPADVVVAVAEALPLPQTQAHVNVAWQEVISIEPAGIEHVYDLTVEGIHNFVANNIIVHNCVYQEQIMQIGAELFGYSLGEADMMRRAVSKKKKEDLQKHRTTFEQRGPDHGVDPDTANKIFDDIEFFARYGFNKCLPGDVEVIDAATGRLVRIEDLANGTASIEHTITCDTENLTLKSGHVSAVMNNGIKPVYRLRTWSGNEIEATANHPFYTQEGWRMLGELTGKESIAVAQHIPIEGTKEWSDERLNEVVASLSEEDPNAILPDDAFELTNSQVAKLLARIWETYGQLLAPDNFWDVIFIKSYSKRLIRQLRHLCARLGIWCAAHTSLYNIETDTRYIPLVTAHISSFYAFMEKIAPFVRSEAGIAQLQRAGELHTEWEWPRLNNWYRTPGTPVSTDSDFLSSDILWDPIYSIEYIGEKQTYDLTVPDTHNFIANDFIVHNSHAADYAILTCQTAFLKCHYTHEYMTALMSVHRDDSAKVSLFAADCQRMGIQVLAPDVNASLLDFHVEKKPDGTRAIRFGLGAVKNVGVGPLEHIISRRDEGGPFRDLDDFCHRCDLRVVQKRALESLIRVGALDQFGKRHVLLAILDRMMSFSADYHKAKEAGQMSLFGDSTGVVAEDSLLSHLPDIEDVPRREQLRWEKELVGLYVSSHPLQAVLSQMGDLAASNILTTSEIIEAGDEMNGKGVQIVGLVTEIRSIITKKGDAMAILTVEDITGTISAVLFPRTWAENRKQVAEDTILKIIGKADTSRGDVQIVVDKVTQDLKTYGMAASDRPKIEDMRLSWMDEEPPPAPDGNGNGHAEPTLPPAPIREERAPVATQTAERLTTDREAPPEDYDWMPDDSPIVAEPVEERRENGTPPPAPAAKTRDQMPTAPISEPLQTRARRKPDPKPEPPPPPPGHLLTLIIERTGDSERDRRRMQNLHGYLIQFPGHDHFSFILTGGGQKRVRIDYPKHPIEINDEMLDRLVKQLGAQNVIVE